MSLANALTALARATHALADARRARDEIDIAKADRESEIAASLIGSPNPLTSKVHSATSAKDAAASDEAIMAFRMQRIALDHAAVLAEGAYQVALLRAQALASEHAARMAVYDGVTT